MSEAGTESPPESSPVYLDFLLLIILEAQASALVHAMLTLSLSSLEADCLNYDLSKRETFPKGG